MRRTIRARPIDPYRRMWVISDPSVVYDDEEDTASEGLAKRGTVVDLPIPPVIDVQTYEKEHVADFVVPRPFIRFPIKPEGYEEQDLEYDLDHEDEVWTVENAMKMSLHSWRKKGLNLCRPGWRRNPAGVRARTHATA
jgi:hypothetical protein